MRELNLCVLTSSCPRWVGDDASIFIDRFANAISEHCRKITLVVPADSSEPLSEQRGSIRVHRFRYGIWAKGQLAFGAGLLPNLQRNPLLIFQLPGLLMQMVIATLRYRESVDIVHGKWLLSGSAALMVRLLTGKPYVLTVLGSDMKIFRHLPLRLLAQPVIAYASRVTCISEKFKETLTQHYPKYAQKIDWIPYGIDVSDKSPEECRDALRVLGVSDKALICISVGRVIPLKQNHLTLRIFSQLPSEFQMLFVGSVADHSYVNELRTLANELGCAERVHFVGARPPELVLDILRAAGVFISSSSFEGRPNSVLEAMRAGLPVFVSDIEAHREIVSDGVTGFLFAESNIEQVVDRITSLRREQSQFRRVIANARRESEQFSWSACAKRYADLYRVVLEEEE